MNKKHQQLAAYGFGVLFVVALILLAIIFPTPTPFQYTVFRVVLALAAAGIAAMIPGFVQVTVSTWLKAGGALGVFVVVFFFNPAQLVIQISMDVTPQTDVAVSGDKEGPFEPDAVTYRMTASGGDIYWKATSDVDWVTIDPSDGKTTSGNPTLIDVRVNPKASKLRIGPHPAAMTFTNQTNRSGDTIRRVNLDITADRFVQSTSTLPIRPSYLPRLRRSVARLVQWLQSDFATKVGAQDI